MNIFVIQVLTHGEEKFIARANRISLAGESLGGSLIWPRRDLEVKKAGKKSIKQEPLYPGYLFYQAETVEPRDRQTLKRIPGFVRFLRNNQNIEPLSGEDKSLLKHFLSFGEVAQRSLVYFDEDNLIRIIQGPLKGLEGRIIKVNKRKKRAKVVLSLYNESFPIDLGFEVIEHSGEEK